MLTRIVHNSPKLCDFFDQLEIKLSQPQRRHLLNMADALLVCEDKKTLAALQRQFIEAPDASNMADFLRISPWSAEEVRAALRAHHVAWAIDQAEQAGAEQVITINIDDSIGEKHKATTRLEPVAWHHDHTESTKGRPRYKNGFCYLVCTLCVGQIVVTVDLRLYLRAKTVRRLNRQRPREHRLAFRSKNTIAKRILRDVAPLLPEGWKVYVQFDSWYASAKLLKFVRRHRWHVTCGLKSNRTLNGTRLDQHARMLRHKWYARTRVTAADGKKTTYYVRQMTGRLADLPFDVRVLFSKRHPRERSPAYFACTDLACTARRALQGYTGRWSCEVDNFYLKTQVGLADFRVQSYEAVDKYMVVVQLAWAYVERRFTEERGAHIKCYGDLIRRHRDEHAVSWLTGAVQMALEGHSLDQVLQRYLRLDALPA